MSARNLSYLNLLLFVLIVGCSSDARVAVVRGTVTLDGTPVGDASVTFMPKEGGRPAFGVTNGDGTYELTTFQKDDGALIGTHVVTITAVDEEVSSKAEELAEEHGSLAEVMHRRPLSKQTWRIPQRFSDNKSSGLQFDVKPGEANQADFALTSEE